MNLNRRRIAALVLVTLTLSAVLVPLSAARSSAAPEDQPGVAITIAGSVNVPIVSDLIGAPDGTRYVGLSTVNGPQATTMVARRTPGGDWEAPETLSSPGVFAYVPRLAVRPDGGVAAIWTEFASGTQSVWYAERPSDGAWSEPLRLTADGRQPRVAVAANGDVVAVWRQASTYRIVASDRPTGGEWSHPVIISAANAADYPTVAVDPAGNAVALFERIGGSGRVQSARKPVGEAWSDPFDVSVPMAMGVDRPEVLVDAAGRATAVWVQYYPDGPSDYAGRAATAWLAPGAAAWSPTTELSAATADSRSVAADLGADGTVTAAWTETDDAGTTVRSARGAAGAWSGSVPIAAAPGATTVPDSVAVDVRPDGGVAAGWLATTTSGDYTVQVATTAAHGAWSTSRPVAEAGSLGYPRVALTADGDVDAVYGQNADGFAVKAVFVDRTAPLVDPPVLPSGAVSGMPLDFSVVADDRWSDLDEVTWDFGDGGTASGASAGHAYAAGGDYRVSVTVRDSAGNAATRTASLTVAEPPRPPASETPAPAPGVVAPRIESLHLTTARIRPVGVRARLPRATRLQVRATGADQITVEVAGKGAGPAKVTLTRPVTAGGATVTLRARIGHRTLTPGRYVVSVVAHGAAGASAPARTTLRVG